MTNRGYFTATDEEAEQKWEAVPPTLLGKDRTQSKLFKFHPLLPTREKTTISIIWEAQV